MGNCVRVHSNRDSPVKFRWSIGATPANADTEIKENSGGCQNASDGVYSRTRSQPRSPEFSVGDELFVDSQPWLDSDNEDYFSVNGDLTPSYVGTPVRHGGSNGTCQPEKPAFVESSVNSINEPSSSPCPIEVKKQLIDLFHESFRDESSNGGPEAKTSEVQFTQKSTEKDKGDTTPARSLKWLKGKTGNSAQCCLPNIARSLSYNEKKKRLSSAVNGGGRSVWAA